MATSAVACSMTRARSATRMASTAARAQLTPTFNDQFIGTVPRDDGTGSVTLAVDIYKPAGVKTPTPVVLWIHGGGWQAGTYNTVPTFLAPLLQQGISIASARLATV